MKGERPPRSVVSRDRPRTVFAIGGSDPSGGAGIQADLKAIQAHGCYGMAAVAALTVQNTRGVSGVEVVGAALLYAQVRAVLDDMPVDVIKVGMLGSPENVRVVARAIEGWSGQLVIDPVGVAKGGRLLQGDETLRALHELSDRATILTPNLEEAGAFTRGVRLVKGGHGEGELLVDTLVDTRGCEIARWDHPRIASVHTHGTGCTLASVLAARLGHGDALVDACSVAIAYVQRQIAASSRGLGRGRGPLWQVP